MWGPPYVGGPRPGPTGPMPKDGTEGSRQKKKITKRVKRSHIIGRGVMGKTPTTTQPNLNIGFGLTQLSLYTLL